MSSASSVNDALRGYLAGRLTAEQLVATIAAEYYRGTRNGERETWRPIVDVIERAHPGVVELRSSETHPGFDVRLAERPFPKGYEAELRQAVAATLVPVPGSQVPPPEAPTPGWLRRIVNALRRVFRG